MSSLAYVLNQICEDYNDSIKDYDNNLRVETAEDGNFISGEYYQITFKQLYDCWLNGLDIIGIAKGEGEPGGCCCDAVYSDYDLTLSFGESEFDDSLIVTYHLSYQDECVYGFLLGDHFNIQMSGADYRDDGFTDEGNVYRYFGLDFDDGVFKVWYNEDCECDVNVYDLIDEEQEALI